MPQFLHQDGPPSEPFERVSIGHIREPSRTPCPEPDPDAPELVPVMSGGGVDGDLLGTMNFLRGGSRGGLTEPP